MAKKNQDTCLSCNEPRRRNDFRSCRFLIVVAGEIWLSPCVETVISIVVRHKRAPPILIPSPSPVIVPSLRAP